MSDSTTPRPVPVTAPAQADVQDAPRYLGSSQGNWFARVGWRHLVAWAAIAFSVFPILFVVSAAWPRSPSAATASRAAGRG